MPLDATARFRRQELTGPSLFDIPIDPAPDPVFDMVGDARMALDAGFAIFEVEYMLDLPNGSVDRMLYAEEEEPAPVKPALRQTA